MSRMKILLLLCTTLLMLSPNSHADVYQDFKEHQKGMIHVFQEIKAGTYQEWDTFKTYIDAVSDYQKKLADFNTWEKGVAAAHGYPPHRFEIPHYHENMEKLHALSQKLFHHFIALLKEVALNPEEAKAHFQQDADSRTQNDTAIAQIHGKIKDLEKEFFTLRDKIKASFNQQQETTQMH